MSGASVIFALRVFAAFLMYMTHLLLARWMGPSELGVFVFALSISTLLAVFATAGYHNTAMRFIPQNLHHGEHGLALGFYRFTQIKTLAIGAVLALTGILIFTLLQPTNGNNNSVFIFAFISIPVHAFIMLNSEVARSFSRIALAFLPEWFWRNILFLTAIMVVYYFSDITLDASTVMFLFLAIVFLVASTQKFFLDRVATANIKTTTAEYQRLHWWNSSYPLMLVILFTGYLPEINILLTGLFLEDDQVGIFNGAVRTANLMMFAVAAVTSMVAPRLSTLFAENDKPELQHLASRAAQLSFIASIAGLLLLFFFGEVILGYFGEEFTTGYSSLIIMAIGFVVIGAVGPVELLLTVAGEQIIMLRITILALLLCILMDVILVPYLGIMGSAVAMTVTRIAWALLLYFAVIKKLMIKPSLFEFQKPASQT